MDKKITAKKSAVNDKDLSLVYSCSGCTDTGQLANALAVRMDVEGYAEMSCIAGVGGDVESSVDMATSGRPIIALDGCASNCVKNCLKRHGVEPRLHIDLSEYRARRPYYEDVSGHETERVWINLIRPAIRNLKEYPASGSTEPFIIGLTF